MDTQFQTGGTTSSVHRVLVHIRDLHLGDRPLNVAPRALPDTRMGLAIEGPHSKGKDGDEGIDSRGSVGWNQLVDALGHRIGRLSL